MTEQEFLEYVQSGGQVETGDRPRDGTGMGRELVREALTRWWGPLMRVHGNASRGDEDPMYGWRIKSPGNEEARRQFRDGYVPQIWVLGLEVPDRALRKRDDGVW